MTPMSMMLTVLFCLAGSMLLLAPACAFVTGPGLPSQTRSSSSSSSRSSRGLAVGQQQRGVRARASQLCMGLEDLAKGSSFQEKVLDASNDLPVLVDFYADWCGPCLLMNPIMTKVSAQYDGKITCLKVNTEFYEELVAEYSIYGLPLIAIFKDGKLLGKHEGAGGIVQVQKLIKDHLPDIAED